MLASKFRNHGFCESNKTAFCGVMRKSFTAAFLVTGLSLTACASLVPTPPSDTYDISAPTSFPGLKGGTPAQILILEPSALKILDSQDIVVKPDEAIVEYLSKSQWSDRLPKVVQARFVEALENTGRVKAVSKPGEGLVIDYQLVSDIRAFQANIGNSNQQAQVSVSVKLVSDRTGKVVRSRIFDESVPLASSTPINDVTALDTAFDKVARQLVAWIFASV